MSTPPRIKRLPLDPARQIPVPWFVAWIDGQPDFRIVPAGKFSDAIKLRFCWICGQSLGSRRGAFTIGPMCAINRVSPEPPAHLECAVYSVTHCPFLTNPARRRRESQLPDGPLAAPAGTMIRRNPGATAIWVSRTWKPFRVPGGQLINVGDPEAVTWYAEGRSATHAEVTASIETGLPLLRAEAEAEGPEAVAELERMHARAMELLP